jgi:SAM-dependent methyltransferase
MPPSLNEITCCEVCGNTDLRPVLDMGTHPMCDDLVRIGDTRICEEYPIEILFCDNCITAHQHYQIPKHILFPQSYHYRSRHTSDVLNGMAQLVAACKASQGDIKGKKVLDIGCNDGSLLSIFAKSGAVTFGIEPTGAAHDAVARGHTVFNEFLDKETAIRFVAEHGHPDLITFTNVFAHIEDLTGVVNSLKVLMDRHTTLVIENHYLGAVIQRNQFDTFYHEHPRTYSYTSFTYIADQLDMFVAKVEFPERYGGNIRVFMAAANGDTSHDRWNELHQQEQSFGPALEQLSENIENWRAKKRAQIQTEADTHGKLAAKAFPGRAAILVKLLGIDEKLISAVYEKPSSGKIGHYVPGTHIPIHSDDEFDDHDGPVLNFAWHISEEISQYLRERGYTGRIIDILSQEDFRQRS